MNGDTDPLAHHLSVLTSADDAECGVWKQALEMRERERLGPKLVSRIGQGLLLLMIVGLIAGMLLPELGKARSSARHLRERMPLASRAIDTVAPTLETALADGEGADARQGLGTQDLSPMIDFGPRRQIVRRAEIQLRVSDVRVAFERASGTIRPEFGEFVESSRFEEFERGPYAQLRLRVSADRLDSALTELRSLGELLDESSSGEDVSARAIDIAARLSNARRVEAELLELMERREDADLSDVLQVRREVNDVRLEIERLEAQRAALGELVALATISVTLHGGDAGFKDDSFGTMMHDAFQGGVESLSRSVAWAVRGVVGLALWWVALLVIVIVGLRMARRA